MSMGVYIPNMEMPNNCWEDDCPCLNKQYGFCQADDDKGFVYSNKPDWCPLIPTADVVPVVRGRWLTKEYMYGDSDVGIEDMWIDRLAESSDYYAYCSICGKDAEYNAEGSLILSDYCPHCGSNMKDGGANG